MAKIILDDGIWMLDNGYLVDNGCLMETGYLKDTGYQLTDGFECCILVPDFSAGMRKPTRIQYTLSIPLLSAF